MIYRPVIVSALGAGVRRRSERALGAVPEYVVASARDTGVLRMRAVDAPVVFAADSAWGSLDAVAASAVTYMMRAVTGQAARRIRAVVDPVITATLPAGMGRFDTFAHRTVLEEMMLATCSAMDILLGTIDAPVISLPASLTWSRRFGLVTMRTPFKYMRATTSQALGYWCRSDHFLHVLSIRLWDVS